MRPHAPSNVIPTVTTAASAPAPDARTCVIVAGMHRSGTSATARVINLLGADIASDLLPSIPGNNDRGFWESASTYVFHDRLFAALDSAWDDPYPLVDGWQQTDAAREAKRAILQHIDKEFADSRMFIVKDPRVSRFLPLWLEALDERSIEPVVVIPFRNPVEVAASLARRDGLPLAQSLLAYIEGNLEAERASRGRRRVFQRYDELLADWRSFAGKLASAGGPRPDGLPSPTEGEIDDFLSGDLRHHRATSESLAQLPDGAAMLAEMYDAMARAAATGDETALRACFDRVSERIREPAKLFRAVAAAQAKSYREEVGRLESRMTAEFARRDAKIEELAAELRQRDARIEEIVAQLHRRDARVEEIAAELRRRDARVEGLAAELHQRGVQVDDINAELRQRGAEMTELRAQLAALQAAVAETARKNALANEEIASLLRSTSWRVTAPLRALGRARRALYRRTATIKAR